MTDPYYADEFVTLYHGDALAVLSSLPSRSVDAVITDPPYSSGGMVRGDRTNANTSTKYQQSQSQVEYVEFGGDNRDQRAYAYWSALWMGEAMRATRPGGVILAFTDWRQLPSTTDAVQSGGWVWRGIVPWVKPTARPQSGRFTSQCEYVAWGSAGPMPMNYADPVLPGFYHAAAPRDREHLTQKPLDVMRELVKIVPEGATVLDPFMGSGTTGCAAVLEGRRFIGVEMVEYYAQVAQRRILTARGERTDDGEQSAFDFGGAS